MSWRWFRLGADKWREADRHLAGSDDVVTQAYQANNHSEPAESLKVLGAGFSCSSHRDHFGVRESSMSMIVDSMYAGFRDRHRRFRKSSANAQDKRYTCDRQNSLQHDGFLSFHRSFVAVDPFGRADDMYRRKGLRGRRTFTGPAPAQRLAARQRQLDRLWI